jgi:hypothetical protein
MVSAEAIETFKASKSSTLLDLVWCIEKNPFILFTLQKDTISINNFK